MKPGSFYDTSHAGSIPVWATEDGLHIETAADGFLIEVTFQDGEPHGLYKKYYPNGQIAEMKNFDIGVLEGERRCWNESGELQSLEIFKDGDRESREIYGADGIMVQRDSRNASGMHICETWTDDEFLRNIVRQDKIYKDEFMAGRLATRHDYTFIEGTVVTYYDRNERLEDIELLKGEEQDSARTDDLRWNLFWVQLGDLLNPIPAKRRRDTPTLVMDQLIKITRDLSCHQIFSSPKPENS